MREYCGRLLAVDVAGGPLGDNDCAIASTCTGVRMLIIIFKYIVKGSNIVRKQQSKGIWVPIEHCLV